MDADVFVLLRQPVDTTCATGIDTPAIQTDALGAAARAVVVVGNMDEVGHCAASLLHGLSIGQLLGALARVDDARNDLQSPGAHSVALGIRKKAHPELLYHDHFVTVGVIQQHAGRRIAGEELTLELVTPAAGEQPMGQTDGVDAEESTVSRRTTRYLDVLRAEALIRESLHGASPCLPRLRSGRPAGHFQQMVAELGLHRPLDGVGLCRENDFVEFANHLPATKTPQITTLTAGRTA